MSIHPLYSVRDVDALVAFEPPPSHDYALLLQLLAWIESAVDQEALCELLDDLDLLLREHFHEETCERGLFEIILADAPHAHARVSALIRDHACILADLGALRAEMVEALRPVPPEARRAVLVLTARLRAHEAIEQTLVIDAFGRDLGGGD